MNLVVFDIGGTSVKYGRYQDSAIDKKKVPFQLPKTWGRNERKTLHRVFTELSDADTKRGLLFQALVLWILKKV